MDVSVIIVNYNTKDLLANCIKSIYEHTHDVEFEIIIVDNASSDGSQEYIKDQFTKIILIESDTNLGFGKANNLGASLAKGEFLFLLNSDTLILNNSIFYFLDFYNKNRNLNIGCLGGLLLDENGNTIHSSENFPYMSRIVFNMANKFFRGIFKNPFKMEIRKFENSDYFEVDYITGADLFITKELFFKVGGFDPVFFMYYEETDLQKQIYKEGLKRFIIKKPQIIHLEGASIGKGVFSIRKRIMLNDGMFKYFKKNSFYVNYFIFRFVFMMISLPIVFGKKGSIKERRDFFYSLMS